MPARRRSKRAASVAPRGRVGPPSARLGLLLTALVTVAVASPVAAEEPVELPADAPPGRQPRVLTVAAFPNGHALVEHVHERCDSRAFDRR